MSRTGTKVLDFLDDFNLQECRIDDLNRTDYSFNQEKDWDEIFSIINRKKQESLKYIRSIVNQDKWYEWIHILEILSGRWFSEICI